MTALKQARELLETNGFKVTPPSTEDKWRVVLDAFYRGMGGRTGGGSSRTPFDNLDRRTLKALREAIRVARERVGNEE